MRSRTLYMASFTDERWASGKASFSRTRMMDFLSREWVSHRSRNHEIVLPQAVEDRFVGREVPCSTLQEVVEEFNAEGRDLLQIAAEGHDFEILKSLAFEKNAPPLIHYENRHLSEADRAACRRFLAKRRYVTFDCDENTLAIRRSVFRQMFGWRRRFQLWRYPAEQGRI